MKKTLFTSLSVLLAALMALSCLSVPAFGADDSTISRVSVTVNGDPSTSRGFAWYTDAPGDSVVKIYKNGIDISRTLCVTYSFSTEWQGKYYHKVSLSGLEAGTAYTYTVGDGNFSSRKGSFTTDNCDASIDFITIADVQASNLGDFQKGAATLSAAFELMPDADFVANLGDFTNDSTNEEWDYYDQAFGEMNYDYTLAPISGNHDGLGVEDWFNNMFCLDTSESVQVKDGVNYSFDYGNAHFAVLNTNDVLAISDPQLKWLRNDLNGTDKDWKIVLMHKSPYSLGKDIKWPDALYIRDAAGKVFDECNVDLVLSGHDHMYLRTKLLTDGKPADNGTAYVLAGTAGSKRYEIRTFLKDNLFDTDVLAALTIQKSGHGNYWNGEDWLSTSESNIGGCFSTVRINGTTLTLNAYILSDGTNAEGEQVVTNIDTLSLSKNAGENKITFTGDNSTSDTAYSMGVVTTVIKLLGFTLGKWLPRFLRMLPDLAKSYAVDEVF